MESRGGGVLGGDLNLFFWLLIKFKHNNFFIIVKIFFETLISINIWYFIYLSKIIINLHYNQPKKIRIIVIFTIYIYIVFIIFI